MTPESIYFSSGRKAPWWHAVPKALSLSGKRRKEFYKTKELAEDGLRKLRNRTKAYGTSIKSLPPATAKDTAAALEILKGAGITKSLSDLARDYVQRMKERGLSKSFREACIAFLKVKAPDIKPESLVAYIQAFARFTHLDAATISSLTGKSRSYESAIVRLDDVILSDVTSDQLEGGLVEYSKTYRAATIRLLKAFFRHALQMEWISSSPVTKLRKSPIRIGEVQIYTPKEVSRILLAASTPMAAVPATHNRPAVPAWPAERELVPFFAITLFAGIRSDEMSGEITRLKWENILLDDGIIHLPASITKTGRRRDVSIRPALKAWLEWHITTGGNQSGLIVPCKGTTLRNKRRDVFRAAGVEHVQNGFRHSFASYAAKAESLDIVEKEIGHAGSRELLNRHYRTDIKAAEATAYWSLRPPTLVESKIHRMKAA
jgi:integrase